MSVAGASVVGARQASTLSLTGCDLSSTKVLVVGAGGIGCELVKNLVLSGFNSITMLDLDTIDYSNLNRQFLFRASHVGRSKAEVAKESVEEFPHEVALSVVAEHGDVKEPRFGIGFFQTFDIVLNALDNVGARRHVNRVCLAANVPLIESGTRGYVGQVRAIIKSRTKCFECDPVAAQKSYPICTIRNHPELPVHCITWAKELLFTKLFGGEETDLIDAQEEGRTEAENTGEEKAEEKAPSSTATPAPSNTATPAPPADSSLERLPDESARAFGERIFGKVFGADVERLLEMASLWETRTPPTPLDLGSLSLPSPPPLEAEQTAWSVADSAAVFLDATVRILDGRAAEVGTLKFDKDDADALDFVTAASNLRSAVFNISLQSRWKVKEIAGNIIAAIATTNAIVAGFIVIEACKVLAGKLDEIRYQTVNRFPTGRGRDQILICSALEPPRAGCYVCSGSGAVLSLDVNSFTVERLLEEVVKKHLSFNKPTIDYETVAGDGDQLCEGLADEIDEAEAAKYARYLPLPLGGLPLPIGSGTRLDVEDTSQKLQLKIEIRHVVLDEEKYPSGFVFEDSAAEEAAAGEAAADDGELIIQEGVQVGTEHREKRRKLDQE